MNHDEDQSNQEDKIILDHDYQENLEDHTNPKHAERGQARGKDAQKIYSTDQEDQQNYTNLNHDDQDNQEDKIPVDIRVSIALFLLIYAGLKIQDSVDPIII